MTRQHEQLIALAGVFTASIQVDKLAKTGQIDGPVVECLINSILNTNPPSTLEIYNYNDIELFAGYQFLAKFLARNTSISREVLRYGLSLLMLERKLSHNKNMLTTVAKRLEQVKDKVRHFGILHDNVIAACGSLYEDTISTFNRRIKVMGDITYLQQPSAAAQIRTLLLTGIRSAMLWYQLGGRRWQLIFKRKKLLADILQRLNH